MDLSVLIVLVLLMTVLLRLALVLAVVWLLIPRRLECPRCSVTTHALVVPRPVRALHLERRWCWTCGWVGVSKRVSPTAGCMPNAAEVGGSVEVGGEDRGRARWDDDGQWTPVSDEGWR